MPSKQIEIPDDTSDQMTLSCTLFMSYFRLHMRTDVTQVSLLSKLKDLQLTYFQGGRGEGWASLRSLFIGSGHVGVSKRFSRSISLAVYCLYRY